MDSVLAYNVPCEMVDYSIIDLNAEMPPSF